MGYYTDFNLEVDGGMASEETLDTVLKTLEEVSGYEGAFTRSEIHDGELVSRDAIKWYKHENDMAKLSERLPTTKLSLLCEGEDGKQWIIDALDGATDCREGVMTFRNRRLW